MIRLKANKIEEKKKAIKKKQKELNDKEKKMAQLREVVAYQE